MMVIVKLGRLQERKMVVAMVDAGCNLTKY